MSITMARMEEILESFNAHGVDRIVGNFDENGEFLDGGWAGTAWRAFRGWEGNWRGTSATFFSSPDIRWVDAKTRISDDRAVTEWRVQGTTANGRLNYLGCDLWEFRNGKVLKKDTYYKQVISS